MIEFMLAQVASDEPTPEEIFAGLMICGGALAVILIINVIICVMLSGCLQRIPPQHRRMEPGMVWLLMIPLFNLVWNFFVYQRIPDSFKSHFNSLGRTDVGDCGKGIGLAYAICSVASVIPCVNYVAGPAALVLLIIFLVKVMGLKGQIAEGGGYTAPPPMTMG